MPRYEDALDINEGKIVVDGDVWGWVTGITIDSSSPEELVNVIGGQLRRRRPEEVSWSVDAATMYDNLAGLKALKNQRFDLIVTVQNPDTTAPADNQTQEVVVEGCRISDENISFSDNSTFRMSGKADSWKITPGH